MKEDTIAAIATPVGNGGIGIVRISGPSAQAIAERIFRKKKSFLISTLKSSVVTRAELGERKLHFGSVIDPEKDRVVDEVLLATMSAPHSYTGEDVVEIQAHASAIGLKMILGLVLKYGARLAEPGEFTKRAFLNGRIDLTQAEAIMDVIAAKSEKAFRLATDQVSGELGEEIRRITEELKRVLAESEASIDFSEETEAIIDIESAPFFNNFRKNIIKPLQTLLKNYDEGHLIRDGLRLVIVGKPNVGKSSLMNRILKKERAIVTPVPGTTRDTIEESVNIQGLTVILSDTAGLHKSEDPVETIGIQRAEKIAGEADLILFMVDAGAGITGEDWAIYEKIKEKLMILVINKIDSEGERKTDPPENWRIKATVRTSVRFNVGIDVLMEKIYQNSMGINDANMDGLVPNLRQKEMLKKSLLAAETAERGIKHGVSPELTAIDLREAIGALNLVVGRDAQIDILDDIFSRFCIGK
jgi:tRNA modification GTPase